MELVKKAQLVAWDIAYEIMIRSLEPLVLFMLHPGGEQYNCLSILRDDGRKLSPHIMITLNGNNIRLGDKTISPYPELYKKNKLNPHKIIPIHTMHPDAFLEFSDKTELKNDGVTFEV